MEHTCQVCYGTRQLPFETTKWVEAHAKWICERCRKTLRISG